MHRRHGSFADYSLSIAEQLRQLITDFKYTRLRPWACQPGRCHLNQETGVSYLDMTISKFRAEMFQEAGFGIGKIQALIPDSCFQP